MAEKTIKTRIQLKYDTLENWTTNSSVVLKKGEIGLVEIPSSGTDTAKTAPTVLFKVGDGTSDFGTLKWASALAADVYAWAKKSGITIAESENSVQNGKFISGISWDSTNNRILFTKGNVDLSSYATKDDLSKYVPTTRTVNGKALSTNISLSATDVGVTETAFPGLKKTGTVTSVKINGTAHNPTSGVVDLGSGFLTSHQAVKLESGTNNGTLKLTVGGTATDNIAVKGLGDLAYKDSLTKSDVGLGSVVNKTLETTVTKDSGNYITSGAVKSYVDSAISGVSQFKYEVVTELPTAAKATMGKIYLVADQHSATDKYDEFITLESGTTTKVYSWEKIGNTDIDLSGYINAVSGTANSGVVTNITKSGSTLNVTSTNLATDDPSASGNATSFIATISQGANGKITATKKSILNASTSTTGLMTAADKIKLNGIAEGANKYTLPIASSDTLGGVKPGTTNANTKVYGVSVSSDGAMTVSVPWTDTNTDTGVTSVEVPTSGNALTGASISGRKLTFTKGTFLTSHQDISGKQDKLTAGSHISISNNTISATWPTASDSGYAGIGKTGTVTSVSAGTGLKVTGTASVAPKVEIDDSVVFVFDCGSASVNID